jgi:hypothetical protein
MDQAINSLAKDSRWEGWPESSFENFQTMASVSRFAHQVPETVVKCFEVVRKLILHSYFEYEFLDVAFEKTLFIFELALKIRYEEINGKRPTRKCSNLLELIEWASKKGMFEDDETAIQSIRQLRNVMAHPERNKLFGYLSLDCIQKIVEVINGLYEDVNLRKSRKHEEARIESSLDEYLKKGAELELHNIRLIIFKASLLYYDNKVLPPKCYFLFWPIFDLAPRDERVNVCEPIVFSSNYWEFTDDVFRFKSDVDEHEAKLRRIAENENVHKYEKWRKDFEASEFPLRPWINYRIGEIKSCVRSSLLTQRNQNVSELGTDTT